MLNGTNLAQNGNSKEDFGKNNREDDMHMDDKNKVRGMSVSANMQTGSNMLNNPGNLGGQPNVQNQILVAAL